MPLYRASLRALGAVALLALALACKGKSESTPAAATTTVTLSGTVTYKRVPLAKDAAGVPTGLMDASVEANLQSLPARGAQIRVFQQVEQPQPDGTKAQVWMLVLSRMTDANGAYSLTLTKDRPTMVELLSSFYGGDHTINLVAETTGLASPTPVFDRLRYALRKAADGTAPAGLTTPASLLTTDAVVNFSVGLNDTWWLVNPAVKLSSNEAPLLGQAVLETSVSGRTAGQGSGSRILGIGDSIASFVTTYATATPGAIVDLHYWPGRSEAGGSYIEYDRSRYPQAYDTFTGTSHYFGTLQGGPANDDAWDEGVIFPLLARSVLQANTFLYGGGLNRTFAAPGNPLLPVGAPLTNLSPDLARIEGLTEAMAANLLKSPYLADTQGTGLAGPVRDIRDLTGLGADQLTPYSAPAIRAFAWEVILKANGVASPGSATTWANLNPLATFRLFLAPPRLTSSATDSTAHDVEPLNIFTQIGRLSEPKGNTEPVDLAAIFTDAALTPLAAPFGLTWPRPTTGAYASFVTTWGVDPNSVTTPLAPLTLSMAKAVQVQGSYPNASQGEIRYAAFSLNADKRYVLSASLSPALPAGAQVEVDLPRMAQTFTFTGTGGSTAAMVIPMGGTNPPYFHPVRIRLRSPSAVQPDVAVTLSFTPSL